MRVLITGACGFAGRYLVAELTAAGHEPYGFGLEPPPEGPFCPVIQGDILKPDSLLAAVRQVNPEAGVHLAAMASPPDAATKGALMAAVNVQGTVHVLEAFRKEAPNARLLVVSSARVYGSGKPGIPICEEDPLNPDSLYAVTKEAADRITLQYAKDFRLPFMTARPHNHTGPGQAETLIVGSFVAQFRRMGAGEIPAILKTGNLDSSRDFLDVRDVVRAYRLLLETGCPGLAYNIAANRPVTIRDLIGTLSRLSGVKPETRVDPARFRPVDSSALLDTTRLEKDTGWRPHLSLEETLRDMLTA
jgi:GDP-4-dehydro-6-deoxy-D-mannose reductase